MMLKVYRCMNCRHVTFEQDKCGCGHETKRYLGELTQAHWVDRDQAMAWVTGKDEVEAA